VLDFFLKDVKDLDGFLFILTKKLAAKAVSPSTPKDLKNLRDSEGDEGGWWL
jgi:hypothetical protein